MYEVSVIDSDFQRDAAMKPWHVVWHVCVQDGRVWCDCEFYADQGRMCWHVLAVLWAIGCVYLRTDNGGAVASQASTTSTSSESRSSFTRRRLQECISFLLDSVLTVRLELRFRHQATSNTISADSCAGGCYQSTALHHGTSVESTPVFSPHNSVCNGGAGFEGTFGCGGDVDVMEYDSEPEADVGLGTPERAGKSPGTPVTQQRDKTIVIGGSPHTYNAALVRSTFSPFQKRVSSLAEKIIDISDVVKSAAFNNSDEAMTRHLVEVFSSSEFRNCAMSLPKQLRSQMIGFLRGKVTFSGRVLSKCSQLELELRFP